MSDVLCCKKCQQPLKIVCDAHGTDWVPDRQLVTAETPPLRTDQQSSPLRRGAYVARPGSKRAAILAVLQTYPDKAWTASQVAQLTGRSAYVTGVELCTLFAEGRVRRVGRGLYQWGGR